jgi:dissimilatory sulfite reductase (desulfoviridin) alpha/beta subunit
LDQPGLRLSGSGCANSCAISHLADIGLLGWSKPAVDESLCTGCGLCAAVCNKKKSISIQNQKAVIDYTTCGYCGECLRSCPYGGIRLEKRGITILAGGRSAVRPDSAKTAETSPAVSDFRLGVPVAEFLNDDQAQKATAALLDWVKVSVQPVWRLLDQWGVEAVKQRLADATTGAVQASGSDSK